MKKYISLAGIAVLFCLLMTGADFRTSNYSSETRIKKNCGYTIIEAGKGVDCYGDTIAIQPVHHSLGNETL